MSNLQYAGTGLIAAIVVWGLYSAYMFLKINIAIAKDPYKRHLLNQLMDGDIPIDGPGAVRIPRPMVSTDGGPLHAMTDEEMKEQSRRYAEATRRRERHHDAVLLLMGSAAIPKRSNEEIVTIALALSEELAKQNASRPLPAELETVPTVPTLPSPFVRVI